MRRFLDVNEIKNMREKYELRPKYTRVILTKSKVTESYMNSTWNVREYMNFTPILRNNLKLY